jgi:hypothetical protein
MKAFSKSILTTPPRPQKPLDGAKVFPAEGGLGKNTFTQDPLKKLSLNQLAVIIPCYNEANNIESVLEKMKKVGLSKFYVGIDANTTDDTETVAQKAGATTIKGKSTGYDQTVSIATELVLKDKTALALLYSDAGNKYPYESAAQLLKSLNAGADIVLGVRLEQGSTMLWHQKLGTQAVLLPLNVLMRSKIKDISPYRLVRREVFENLSMNSLQKFRWPSEMLIKALALGLKVEQVPVASLARQGQSTVSGSWRNSLRAGIEMFSSLKFFRYK